MNTYTTVLDNASAEATTSDWILQIASAAWRQGNFVQHLTLLRFLSSLSLCLIPAVLRSCEPQMEVQQILPSFFLQGCIPRC